MTRTLSPFALVSALGTSLLMACAGPEAAEAPASSESAQLAAAVPGGGRAVETSAPSPGEPSLDEVRRATEKYRDVAVAEAEGYVRDPMDLCDTAEMMGRPAALGAMGIHYFRPDLLGIAGPPNPRVDGTGTHTDFRMPAILIYEPQQDGSLELVAVENLTFEKAWQAAGNTAPPSFHGVPYDRMADDPATSTDEGHMFEPHYDRHVWLYRDNPNGVFAQYNPDVSCEHPRRDHVPRALSGRKRTAGGADVAPPAIRWTPEDACRYSRAWTSSEAPSIDPARRLAGPASSRGCSPRATCTWATTWAL